MAEPHLFFAGRGARPGLRAWPGRFGHMLRSRHTLAAAWLLGLAGISCTARVGGDGQTLAQHNDDLRREKLALRKELDQAEQKMQGLAQELEAYRKQNQQSANEAPGFENARPPILSDLDFARYTGPVDTDRDGVDDELRLYVRPVDQMGRMLVVAGSINIQLLDLQAEQPPKVIDEQTVSPEALDDAYRTGLTGDHYSLKVKLPLDRLGEVDHITVLTTLTQAETGRTVDRQERFNLKR